MRARSPTRARSKRRMYAPIWRSFS
jgi:hypothetical protein